MKGVVLGAILFGLMATSGCSKSKEEKDCDRHYIQLMKQNWRLLSSCTINFQPYLGKGIYESKVIYYASFRCDICDMMPPQAGVNCAGDSIPILDWSKVTDTKIIATCLDH